MKLILFAFRRSDSRLSQKYIYPYLQMCWDETDDWPSQLFEQKHFFKHYFFFKNLSGKKINVYVSITTTALHVMRFTCFDSPRLVKTTQGILDYWLL